MKINVIVKDDIAIPVVNANKKGVIVCPYCDKEHKHGVTNDLSHRVSHCDDKDDKYKMFIVNENNSYELKKTNGYYVQFT